MNRQGIRGKQRKRVVTFGEIMMRLAAPKYMRIASANSFDITYAGAEANVAASLARFGVEADFVSTVPKHDLGDAVVQSLQAMGVGTKFLNRGGNRLGLYFLEHGASVRSSKVVYDRARSSMTEARKGDFNFKQIFKGADWFHVSGITVGLSKEVAQLVEEGLKVAKSMGLTTSFDFNHRAKLWSLNQAQKMCVPLMKYVDVCLDVGLSKKSQKTIVDLDGFKPVIEDLQSKFDFKYITTTFRENLSASDNRLQGLFFDGKNYYKSKTYDLHIVDRVGGGDAFSGGIIYSLLARKSKQAIVDFAVAASALKHTIEGDFNQVSASEVEQLVDNQGDSRVVR